MKTVDRRTILSSGALALASAATRSAPAAAQTGLKPIFSVPAITVPIVGEECSFPVRRIYCIGRNYASHAIERCSDPKRAPPIIFQKPTNEIQNVAIGNVQVHPYPAHTN